MVNMKYKSLILDFDGTIADTKQSILVTMQLVADHFSVKKFDEKLVENLIGLPLKDTFEKAFSFDEKSIQDATIFYRNHYNEIAIDSISLFDGVKDTLLHFHKKGINLAVASSKGKEALNKILRKHPIHHLFSFVGGEEDVSNKKPAPDIVNLIVAKHHYRKSECLVIGDTIFDVEMGQSANVDTCAVTYGNNTREKLEKQQPNYIVDSFSKLIELV